MRSVAQALTRRAADFPDDAFDALGQRRRGVLDQPFPRTHMRGAAAIDRVALAGGAHEAFRDRVQVRLPLAGGDGKAELARLFQRTRQARVDMRPIVARGCLQSGHQGGALGLGHYRQIGAAHRRARKVHA